MRAGFYQFAPVFGEPEHNLSRVLKTLEKAEADIAVLPELPFSGYLFTSREETEKLSEPVPGKITEKLSELSIKKNMAIASGFTEKGKDSTYNSAVFITPDGKTGLYRKNHLFHEEKLYFSPGDSGFPVFTYRDVKIGLLVCFDHIFPEAARTLAMQGVQLVCHPSNLVLKGKAQATTRSRSIENRIFWVLANRFGTETRGGKSLSFSGCSQITDPDGRIMVQAGSHEEGFFCVDIDPETAKDKQVTPLCGVFQDRRPDIYLL